VATAPRPRVAIEIGSAAEIPELSASTDFTTVITVAMPTASRVSRVAAASPTGAGRQAGLSGLSNPSHRASTKAMKASPPRIAAATGSSRDGSRLVASSA